jgi:hypothetical protein
VIYRSGKIPARNYPAMTSKKTKKASLKQSSSAYFQELRPKFLDWRPPTEAEKALEVQARRDAKDAELEKVIELAKSREAEKAATRKNGLR